MDIDLAAYSLSVLDKTEKLDYSDLSLRLSDLWQFGWTCTQTCIDCASKL